jgi:PAS domain S-box-containing protein
MAVNYLSNISRIEKKSSKNDYPRKSVTETIVNGFFTVDRKWIVRYWNKAAEKLLKVQARDIVGKNLWEEFANIIPSDFYAVYHKSFLQDIPVHFEEYWGEMGAWFDVITYHCDDTLSVSFKSSDQPHLEYQKNTVQRLKILTELYRFVTEITNDCLWEWDLQTGELFWIDGGHKRVFGYQIENATIPQSFWESRLHPEDKVRILASLNKIITEGSCTTWENEYRFKKANGDYAYVHDRGHIIYDADKRASRMIGATQDITEKVLLENRLINERGEKQKEITDAVLTALENERSSIARELHDNVNQILSAAKLYNELAKIDKEKTNVLLTKSSGFIMNAIEEIRKISKAIDVSDIHIMGLLNCIKSLLNDLNMVNPVKIEFKNTIIETELDEKLQLNILRIVQEHLTNILKHAEATLIKIDLSRDKNDLILFISDNGRGCDTSEKKKGVGIRNIMSRAELFQGKAEIESQPGKGFQLKVILPYPVTTHDNDNPTPEQCVNFIT